MSGVKKWADKINAELSGVKNPNKKLHVVNSESLGLLSILGHIQQRGFGETYENTKTKKLDRSAIIMVDEVQRSREVSPIHTDRQMALNKLANAWLLSNSYDHENSEIKELDPKNKKAILANDNSLQTVRNFLFTTSHEIAHRPTSHRLQNAVGSDERVLETFTVGPKSKGKDRLPKYARKPTSGIELGRTP